jgi:hypothetical protein
MSFKIKEVDCITCGKPFMGKKIKTRCKRCSALRYLIIGDNKVEVSSKLYDHCCNCMIPKSISTSGWCADCYNPVSDKLWKFNEFVEEHKIRNEIVLEKLERSGLNSFNCYLVCDAWLYITRYESKWITKSVIQQVNLMIEELKEYNQNLYTRTWWDLETKKRRLERKQARGVV